jgi:phosphopantothenoylcysteine decarboxylase/phosphopantothenate--cysteine ligase
MKILITSGPTREKLDPVRFLSNRSTGKMGYALAEAAVASGWEVTLVSGPVALTPPEGVAHTIQVESASEMAEAVWQAAPEQDVIIMAAAVADYRPAQVSAGKIKKQPGDMVLVLERTPDILAELGRRKPAGQLLVGFAAETDDLLDNAQSKMERKNLDWIIANRVEDSFGKNDNQVIMLNSKGGRIDLAKAPKKEIAGAILRHIMEK